MFKNLTKNGKVLKAQCFNMIKNILWKNCNKMQSEITAKLSDRKMLGAFLNRMNPYLKSQKEGRVTALVARTRYQIATGDQTQQRLEHCAGSPSSNTGIKNLLDS